jgi:FtsH-binding integral membrane protein
MFKSKKNPDMATLVKSNAKLLAAGPLMIPALFLLGLTGAVPYKDFPEAKIGLFGLFCLAQGAGLTPLIASSSFEAITGAALSTGCTMGALGAVTYCAPSQQFLSYNLPLGLLCGAMVGVSMASIAFPQSRAIYNVWLWGGLGVFSAFTIYDVQVCLHKIRHEENYDPIENTLELYMDAMNLFVRFLAVMNEMDKSDKKE